MESLKHFIRHRIELSTLEWEELGTAITCHTFTKGETILAMGDVCRDILFITEGIARSYLIKEDGKDFTWHFHFSGSRDATLKNFFIVDYASFTGQTPSAMYIEALTDCTLIGISYQTLHALYASDVKWQYLGRIIAEEAYRLTQQRTLALLSLSAKERLRTLLQEYPSIFDKVPHYHIASYLGITPQSLSRLRRHEQM